MRVRKMSMDTNQLLKKYDKNYVPGERRTTIRERLHKQNQTNAEKHALADELLRECNIKYLTRNDYEHVHYLVDKFNDFNKLHRKANCEQIILTFIFYTIRIKQPNRQLSDYPRITKKYSLTNNIFELIVCRMLQSLLSETPIVPRTVKKYDNDILYRTGQR